MAMEQNNVRFSSFFRPSEVLCQTGETDRDVVVMDLLRLLARRRDIGDIDDAFKAVVDREKDLPTIVAPGMAMPHARLEAVPEILVAVATSGQGIVYDPARPDDRVKLIVLTLAPKASPGAYLQAISCVATICRAPSTAELVASLPTADLVWSFFDKGATPSSAPPKSRDTSGAELR
jgi:PTS system nitrogen regulatory IIA component